MLGSLDPGFRSGGFRLSPRAQLIYALVQIAIHNGLVSLSELTVCGVLADKLKENYQSLKDNKVGPEGKEYRRLCAHFWIMWKGLPLWFESQLREDTKKDMYSVKLQAWEDIDLCQYIFEDMRDQLVKFAANNDGKDLDYLQIRDGELCFFIRHDDILEPTDSEDGQSFTPDSRSGASTPPTPNDTDFNDVPSTNTGFIKGPWGKARHFLTQIPTVVKTLSFSSLMGNSDQ